MPSISTENLESSEDIYPPKLVKKRGRPRAKRMQKNNWKRKPQKCSNCFSLGHNKRRCTNQPGRKNGRGERARDWLSDDGRNSDSGSGGGRNISSSDGSGSGSESCDDGDSDGSSRDNSTGSDDGQSNTDNRRIIDESEDGELILEKEPERVLPARQRKRPARYQG